MGNARRKQTNWNLSVWKELLNQSGTLQLNHWVPQNGHLEQCQIFPGEATLPNYIQGDSIKSSRKSKVPTNIAKKMFFLPQLALNTLLVFDSGSPHW